MTEYKKVYLDTTPLIYFLDEDINFGDKAKAILEEILLNGKEIVSSVITCMEYMVYPYRVGNLEKIEIFHEFMDDNSIRLVPISVEIAHKAAQIRAVFRDFKAMDCLQLATAVITGCDLFLTNDNQLRQFTEIKCVTVEEWESA